ncbi:MULTISPECIES: hypothetical protein [Sphingobacterium]|uniref:Uncharacterized protein n=1 Tax=Sphingobacterium populi TaxID=1812824 RepID=A0ABW5U9K1_9SPHI|nr:hypothetical protein [Sphingobacterium sp. CFCC 11742]
MSKILKDRGQNRGFLDFVFAEAPLFGVLSILISDNQSKAKKITTIAATFVGLIAAAIVT